MERNYAERRGDILRDLDGLRAEVDVEKRIGYLTLDRQARTLSGGEVQRANLTTALGSGLVNTLFVLDEPTADEEHFDPDHDQSMADV